MNSKIKLTAFHVMKWCVLGMLAVTIASCGVGKKVHKERLYLQGIDTALVTELLYQEPKIQKGDLLTIIIYSDNMEAVSIYNQPQNAGAASMGAMASPSVMGAMGRGYQVDARGMIQLHKVGLLLVEGKTRQEVEAMIIEPLREELNNPYVVVRFANRRVTVLGEVNRPGVIELPDQQITILQAIGLSGDLTVFGRRDNILVVREENNVRTMARLNIRDPDIFSSPYFYLKQNDFVYVEPTTRKTAGNDAIFVRNVSVVASLLSVVTLAISLLTK